MATDAGFTEDVAAFWRRRGAGEAALDALEAERARLFLWAPVALSAGIALYFALAAEPSLTAALSPLAFALLSRLVVARGTLASAVATSLLLTATGFALAKVRVEAVRAPVLERTLRNADVAGVVIRAEKRTRGGQRLTLAVDRLALLDTDRRPAIVRISVLKAGNEARPGDRVELKATLSPPSGPVLPGGFDYARTAYFERLGGVGYAFVAPRITPVTAPDPPLATGVSRRIEDLRQWIGERVRAALPGETGAIATALITGERAGISAETNAAFKNSGLFHILSISGLHMVVMAGAIFFLVRVLLAAVPRLALTLPIKKIAAVAGIAAALLYLAISGGQFATVRAALMIVIMFTAVLLDRPALALRNVALAAFAILLLYPESLLDAGFQMSFAAVTALIAVYEVIRQRFRRSHEPHPVLRVAMFFGGIVLSTIIASVAVAPFAAYHFHQSQQYAVIANLLAIPICNFIVMPAALVALLLMPFGLEAVALYPMGLGITAMKWCADLVAAIPGAVGHIPAMPVFAFALMIVGGLWLALWQTRLRFLGAAAVLAGVLAAPSLERPDLLIGRGGEIVAVRGSAGRLSALPARSARFEIARWLEHDGDGRTAREAEKGEAFTCDAAGCLALVKGRRIAVARRPAAVNDDCSLADIVVLPAPRPKSCPHPALVVDVFDIWRKGAHAVYFTGQATAAGGGLRIETVAAERGARPWSGDALGARGRRPSVALPKPVVAPDRGAVARPEPSKREAARGPAGEDTEETDADSGFAIPDTPPESDGE